MEFIVGIIALAAFAFARNANIRSKEITARLAFIEASLGLSPPKPELKGSRLAPPMLPETVGKNWYFACKGGWAMPGNARRAVGQRR